MCVGPPVASPLFRKRRRISIVLICLLYCILRVCPARVFSLRAGLEQHGIRSGVIHGEPSSGLPRIVS